MAKYIFIGEAPTPILGKGLVSPGDTVDLTDDNPTLLKSPQYFTPGPLTVAEQIIEHEKILLHEGLSFSVSQIRNFSAAQSLKKKLVFCVDCITPDGIGGWCGYTPDVGWRLLRYNLNLTTDLLTYFRYCRSSGTSVRGKYDFALFDDGTAFESGSGWGGGALQNGASSLAFVTGDTSVNGRWRLAQNALDTGTSANNGGARRTTAPLFRSQKANGCGFYASVDLFFAVLSTAGDEFAFRFGFDNGGGSQYALASEGYQWAYDRGNTYGSNASNLDRWMAFNRASGVNTTPAFSSAAPSVSRDAFDNLEIFIPMDASRVDYYLNGVLVNSVTNSIPTTIYYRGVMVLLKSAGLNARSVLFDYVYFHARRPEGVAQASTIQL